MKWVKREGGRSFPCWDVRALGRKAAKRVRVLSVVVLYPKDFGSGLPFYSQRAVWEPSSSMIVPHCGWSVRVCMGYEKQKAG